MNDVLPQGWVMLPFMEIFDIQGGTQPPKSAFKYQPEDGYIRLLQIRDFGDRPVPTYIPLKANLKTCEKHDILIGRYGASVGRICTDMEGAYNVALTKVIIPKLIERRYAFHLLQSSYFQRPILDIERSAQDGFNKEDLAEIQIPLAPLNEQRRIVAKLEILLGKVEACKKRLEKIPVTLKRFRQSILAATCSGRLTADWREENPNSEEWKTVELFEVSERIQIGPFGTQVHKSDYISNGMPLINPTHIQDSKIAHNPEFSVSKTKYKELENYVLQENDIILGRRGEMGRCALVSRKENGWLCGTGSLFVRPKPCVHQNFCFSYSRAVKPRRFWKTSLLEPR